MDSGGLNVWQYVTRLESGQVWRNLAESSRVRRSLAEHVGECKVLLLVLNFFLLNTFVHDGIILFCHCHFSVVIDSSFFPVFFQEGGVGYKGVWKWTSTGGCMEKGGEWLEEEGARWLFCYLGGTHLQCSSGLSFLRETGKGLSAPSAFGSCKERANGQLLAWGPSPE